MCGIVGYVGNQNAVPVILDGLHRLEYRGYDSAGVSVVENGALNSVKSLGKLAELGARLKETPLSGQIGIGHTRWATHGVPSEVNSHPHFDDPLEIAVVHNGIIENYQELGMDLREAGVQFRSETDTETLAHLIRKYYDGDLYEAVTRALRDVKGAYAIAVVCKNNPDELVAARQGSPLVVGLGTGENFVASDAPAILKYTRRVIYLEDGQVTRVRAGEVDIQNLLGQPQPVVEHAVDWDEATAEKGGFPHFMLKEIHEQPEVIRNTLRGRIAESGDAVTFEDLALPDEAIRNCPRIILVACGTARHAALAGELLLESFAGIPADVDIASEFRYRDLMLPEGAIVIAISQSGETADTLEAIRIARQHGARVLSVVNVVGSSIPRESDAVLYLRAGMEIGVASTKAYTAMLAGLSLFAIHCGIVRGTLTKPRAKQLLDELRAVPEKMQWCLDHQDAVEECAADPRYRDAFSALYIARGYNFANAFEGALKLKEISYIHAEGCGAGELKHGAIALVSRELPVVCIAVESRTYEKMISNIQEVRARRGIVLSIGTDGDEELVRHSDRVLYVPECPEYFSPIVVAVPMQLLAYYIARNRGCDVDQPRNLAKSVTVE